MKYDIYAKRDNYYVTYKWIDAYYDGDYPLLKNKYGPYGFAYICIDLANANVYTGVGNPPKGDGIVILEISATVHAKGINTFFDDLYVENIIEIMLDIWEEKKCIKQKLVNKLKNEYLYLIDEGTLQICSAQDIVPYTYNTILRYNMPIDTKIDQIKEEALQQGCIIGDPENIEKLITKTIKKFKIKEKLEHAKHKLYFSYYLKKDPS